jgi:hypothetical protein
MKANTRNIAGMLSLASESDLHLGSDWYARAHRFGVQLIHAYDGLTLGQAVGVIAALSPRNKWERNMIDAEAMIRIWSTGSDDFSSLKVCTFNTNKNKAAAILSLDAESVDTEAVTKILSGQKVCSFYRSIMGDDQDVCVDGHAYAIFIGERVTTTTTPKLTPKAYETIQRAYRLVAQRSFDLCGHNLTPIQVQAVTWVIYRRLVGIKG